MALKFASMGCHAFVLRYSTYDERGKNVLPMGAMPAQKKRPGYCSHSIQTHCCLDA